MKVVLEHGAPFMLAPGGAQVQIEQTRAALTQLGVAVEPLRWWDASQTGDVLHHFGKFPAYLQRVAQHKGMKVVMSAYLGGLGARPAWMRRMQRLAFKIARPVAPLTLRDLFGWDSYRIVDALLAQTPYEASLLVQIHGAPKERVHVLPNGVEEVFLRSIPGTRGKWLVCTANIIGMKRVLELAQMAVRAQTPVWIIGRPHSAAADYFKRFTDYARQNSALVRYEGGIAERERLAQIYREARGFVLLSEYESLSISALESAACGCPLFLSDLPWAREAFKDKAWYCPVNESIPAAAVRLRRFYDAAPDLPLPPRPLSWLDVGQQLKTLYERL